MAKQRVSYLPTTAAYSWSETLVWLQNVTQMLVTPRLMWQQKGQSINPNGLEHILLSLCCCVHQNIISRNYKNGNYRIKKKKTSNDLNTEKGELEDGRGSLTTSISTETILIFLVLVLTGQLQWPSSFDSCYKLRICVSLMCCSTDSTQRCSNCTLVLDSSRLIQ